MAEFTPIDTMKVKFAPIDTMKVKEMTPKYQNRIIFHSAKYIQDIICRLRFAVENTEDFGINSRYDIKCLNSYKAIISVLAHIIYLLYEAEMTLKPGVDSKYAALDAIDYLDFMIEEYSCEPLIKTTTYTILVQVNEYIRQTVDTLYKEFKEKQDKFLSEGGEDTDE